MEKDDITGSYCNEDIVWYREGGREGGGAYYVFLSINYNVILAKSNHTEKIYDYPCKCNKH